MAGFLDEKHKEIQARLKELKPLVDEYRELEAADKALSALGKAGGSTAAAAGAAPARAQIRHLTWCVTVLASPSPRWRRPWGFSRTTCTACCPASPKRARSSSPAAVGT